MPFGAPKPCNKHPRILLNGKDRCPECVKSNRAHERERRVKRGPRFYDRKIWRMTIRPHKLAINPVCEECERQGLIVTATEVDHIKSIASGGDPYDYANLQSLCKPCHTRKTNEVDGGLR